MSEASVERSQLSRPLSWLVKFNDFLCLIMTTAALTLTTVFIVLTLMEVVARTFFRYSFIWSNEFATATFVWSLFLGSAVLFRSNSHLFVDFLSLRPGGIPDRLLGFVTFTLVLLFACCFAYYGFKLTLRGMERVTPIMQMPMSVGWASLFVMGVTTIPFCIEAYLAPGHVPKKYIPPSAV